MDGNTRDRAVFEGPAVAPEILILQLGQGQVALGGRYLGKRLAIEPQEVTMSVPTGSWRSPWSRRISR